MFKKYQNKLDCTDVAPALESLKSHFEDRKEMLKAMKLSLNLLEDNIKKPPSEIFMNGLYI